MSDDTTRLVQFIVDAFADDPEKIRESAAVHRQFAEALQAKADELDPPLRKWVMRGEVRATVVADVLATSVENARCVFYALLEQAETAVEVGLDMVDGQLEEFCSPDELPEAEWRYERPRVPDSGSTLKQVTEVQS